MTNEPELKPLRECPLCDGNAELAKSGSGLGLSGQQVCCDSFSIFCTGCLVETQKYRSKHYAIRAWNTRTPAKECEHIDIIFGRYNALAEKYKKAIEFIKRVADKKYVVWWEDAEELLRELEEGNNGSY